MRGLNLSPGAARLLEVREGPLHFPGHGHCHPGGCELNELRQGARPQTGSIGVFCPPDPDVFKPTRGEHGPEGKPPGRAPDRILRPGLVSFPAAVAPVSSEPAVIRATSSARTSAWPESSARASHLSVNRY